MDNLPILHSESSTSSTTVTTTPAPARNMNDSMTDETDSSLSANLDALVNSRNGHYSISKER